MTLTELKKLQKICDKLIVKHNNKARGLYCYFEYKDNQYYASLIFDIHSGPDCMIFNALDSSVKSWNPIYHNTDVDEVNISNLKKCIVDYFMTNT